jgi:hypothetical protein
MDAGDCLVCAAAREAGRAECKACGKVFMPIQPDDPSYYFGAPSVARDGLAPVVKRSKRRFRLFGHTRP